MILICQLMGAFMLISFIVVAFSLVRTLRRGDSAFLPKRISRKHLLAYLALVIVLGVMPRLLSLYVLQDTDENYHIYVAGEAYRDLRIYNRINFAHPPMYPLATSTVFRVLGVGLPQAKLIPVALSLLTIPLVYALSRRFYGVKPALFSAFVYSTTPFIILYAGNPMMYAELLFFATLAAYFFLSAVKEGKVFQMFLAGLSVGAASSFRLFGLFLVPVGIAFLAARRKNAKFHAAYLLGFLTVTLPLFSFYYHASPKSLPYLLLNLHEKKEDIGLLKKTQIMVEGVYTYPLVFSFPLVAWIAGIMFPGKKPEKVSDSDADFFFLLWLSGAVLILAIPSHKDFLLKLYVLYFTPPAIFLSGRLAGALDTRCVRTFAACIVLISGGATYFILAEYARNYETIKDAGDFIREHTSASDTITGTFATAHIISFLTGRQITEDVLNITDLGFERYKEVGNAENTCTLEPEEYEKDLLYNSRYVIIRDGEESSYFKKELLVEEGCPRVREYTNITIYSCRNQELLR